jgi:hypothetical protein
LVLRVRAGSAGRAYWDAQWRYRINAEADWRLKKRRLGLAWQERHPDGRWRKRHGRCPEGWLDERSAHLAAVAAMGEHARELTRSGEEAARAAAAQKTVRMLAQQWLSWLEEVWGAKPSTVKDYGFLLREAGVAYKRGDKAALDGS